MKALIILTVDLPEPESAVEIVQHLDPPTVPHFAGEVRVVIEPAATQLIEWLDEDE